MKRGLVLLVSFVWAAPALAAPPAATVQASTVSGAAPLAVTFTATGDAASWHWEFGDGSTAGGAVATHTYTRPGRYVATLTATSAAGETTRVRTAVTAYALTLAAPARATWGKRVRLSGRLTPAEPGVVSLYSGRERVSTARLRDGAWRVVTTLREPGPYTVRFANVRSQERRIAVRPVLDARIEGTPVTGGRLTLVARVRPAAAGGLRVRVTRAGKPALERVAGAAVRIELGSSSPADIRVGISTLPSAGYVPAATAVRTTVVHARLSVGSRGPSVRALERRLRELRYVLKSTDGLYAKDTYEAVLAFQKMYGLPRTGRVDAALWRRIVTAGPPRARYAGTHIEVDKSRQILMEVERGRVVNVLHVSTGATGNTPIGRWNVYRKVPGWDWVLWYPMYFKGGFAIHGYPSVPPYPASHGCVRVPMWYATTLYRKYAYGATVIVYA